MVLMKEDDFKIEIRF